MNSCSNCGRELGSQAKFCGACGTPVGEPQDEPVAVEPVSPRPKQTVPKPTAAVVVAAAVVAVAAAGVTTFALTRNTDSTQPDTAQVDITQPSATAPVTVLTTATQPPTSTEITTTETTPSLQVTEADLRRQTTQDSTVAESLVGQWVPQLSSKQPGLVVGGTTYDYPAIMADFQSLRSRFPEAIMVNSSDFKTFSRKGFWVTLEAKVFPDADAANAWCDEQNFAREDCHASRLTHSGGPAGNSKGR
ncbi:zinc ribbon domain-containing protein [Amycolatopsis alba]|uniref:Zinc ribbon domain-containing protein n=1 Tax=Amycolatopsis alba DSM 44262 TaxID=1125972 RepID=A0A229S825_AMYAL|nr:zinc ribbon domain-containing protein [Amycolatopsis alba]OXM54901.1 zinc ribbon domain-containing protein [Amycolatopsis alba DSM 44262]